MSLIRPAAAAALKRWQEVIAGGVVSALGLYWGLFTGGGLLHWFGYALVLVGLALVVAGLQRARFRRGEGGPGVVQITEGRIAYFGPLSGGIVDLAALSSLTLDPRARPPHWLLQQPGQPALAIPLTARGADALFDAFASLPDIRTEHMLRQMHSGADHPVVIWRTPAEHDRVQRLH